MVKNLYDLRNKLEQMRLEKIDEAEHCTRSGYTPSAQFEQNCLARGIAMALRQVNELIWYKESKGND